MVAKTDDGQAVAYAQVTGHDHETEVAATLWMSGLDGTLHEYEDMELPHGWFVDGSRLGLDEMVREGRMDSPEVVGIDVDLLAEGIVRFCTAAMGMGAMGAAGGGGLAERMEKVCLEPAGGTGKGLPETVSIDAAVSPPTSPQLGSISPEALGATPALEI